VTIKDPYQALAASRNHLSPDDGIRIRRSSLTVFSGRDSGAGKNQDLAGADALFLYAMLGRARLSQHETGNRKG
jgi:hypothetical protein